MKKEAVIRFLQAIGAQNIKETAEWINCSCPLALWKHEKKTDRHPSAGISISDTNMSTWLCYTCTPSAKPAESLLGAIWVASGSYPYEASKILSEEEIFDDENQEQKIEVRTFDIWQDWVKPKQKDVLPRPVIDAFPLLSDLDTKLATEAKRWLFQERNINPGVINVFGLRFWEERNCILFPLVDHKGEIKVIRIRNVVQKKFYTLTPEMVGLEDMTFPKIKNTGVWFGLDKAQWDKPLLLVEGEIDSMRLYSLGWTNVIASCSAAVTKSQVSMLCGSHYLMGFDNDAAGREANTRVSRMIKDPTSIRIIKWAKKDAGNLNSVRELDDAILNAKLIRL